MRLETSANNFERNNRDVFKLEATGLGKLTHVVIHKDNAGLSSDWHLQAVEVFHPGTMDVHSPKLGAEQVSSTAAPVS